MGSVSGLGWLGLLGGVGFGVLGGGELFCWARGILRVVWRGSWAEMPLKGGGDFSIVIGKHNELLFRESWR